MPNSITVIYFAQLQDDAGCNEENVAISTDTNLESLYSSLDAKHHFTVAKSDIRPTKNHDFVDWDESVSAGDTVCFLPPVSGG